MKTAKRPKPTRADLLRKIAELEAGQAFACSAAAQTLHKAGKGLMGSGVVVRLTALGGHELIAPVLIRDGLSDDTIAAIRRDIVRSYELAVAFKPKAD